jgi:parallel beta-helix repeat protein
MKGQVKSGVIVVLVLLLAGSQGAWGDITSGLEGWWKLDGDGSNSSGGFHDAQLFGGPVFVQAKIGEGLDFDGLDDYAQVSYSSDLNPNTFSVACWVKVQGGAGTEWTVVSSQRIDEILPGEFDYEGYALGISSSNKWQFSFAVFSPGFPLPINEWEQLTSSVDALVDTWTHVAVTFRTTSVFTSMIDEILLYIDGVPVASYFDSKEFLPNTSRPLRIGAGSGEDLYPPIEFFDGQLDDVRIYNRVLQQSDIAELMDIAVPVDTPSPSDSAASVDINADLSWSDPSVFWEFYNYRYFVYFGTVNPPTELVGFHQFWDKNHPLGTLDYETTYYWKVDKISDFGTAPGPIWSFRTYGKATAPVPANGAGPVDIDVDLSWTPYENALSHTVYFGTDNPPTVLLAYETLDTTIDPCMLDFATTYYWQVDENIATGTGIVIGDVWSFTTIDGRATAPFPADDAQDLLIDTQLSWTAGPRAENFDIYFGTDNPPTALVAADYNETTYDPGLLDYGTRYYWQVFGKSPVDISEADLWTFRTELSDDPMTLTVDDDGPALFQRIQDAIDAARNGDTIVVKEGSYVENLDMLGKEITLRSTDPLDGGVVLATIIDGGAAGSVITCNNLETSATIISGFLITNGNATNGGGMWNGNNCSPTISNCTFQGNTANYGGGMSNDSFSSPEITSCTFRGNSADDGGGVHNQSDSSTIITNCNFSVNTALDTGGGMYIHSQTSSVISSCTFRGNTAVNHGGGMYINWLSSSEISDCTFRGNIANIGGGMNNGSALSTVSDCIFTGNLAGYAGGGVGTYKSFTLTRCIFHENTAQRGGGMYNAASSPTISYCTFSGNTASFWGGGMHSYYSSPIITNCTFSENTSNNTGGGMSRNPNFPGVPEVSYSNFCLNTPNHIYASYIDNGGVAFNDTTCPPPRPLEPQYAGDVDGDGDVDWFDFALMAANWLEGK